MALKNLLKLHEKTPYFADLINTILTSADARDATLIELYNYPVREQKEAEQYFKKLAAQLDLITFDDPTGANRFFIVKKVFEPSSDEVIGQKLGYLCPGGRFYDNNLDRWAIDI